MADASGIVSLGKLVSSSCFALSMLPLLPPAYSRDSHRMIRKKTASSSTTKPSRQSRGSKRRRLGFQTLESRKVFASAILDVAIENVSPTGGLALTPLWVAAHDGGFVTARAGLSASGFAGFEDLAEEGIVTGLRTRFDAQSPQGVDAVLSAPGGFAGAPVIEPGETATGQLNVSSSEVNRFFSYASMIIPSNDAFIANLNPRSVALFRADGSFAGPMVINVYGFDVYDAGTEVNNPNGAAAFSTEGGTSVDQNGVVTLHRGLNDFIGTGLPTGVDLGSAFNPMTLIARITISENGVVPGPDIRGPSAGAGIDPITTATNFIDYEVIYRDATGVNVSTIGTNDIQVLGRGERPLVVRSVTTDAAAGTNPSVVRATYRLEKTDGSNFTVADNGYFRVFAGARVIADTLGNFAQRGQIGQVEINLTQRVEILVENLAPIGGLSLTPLWVGLHDGRFDNGTLGQAASNFGGLEDLAEEGIVTGVRARFAQQSAGGVDAVLSAPGGFAGMPVIEPGEFSMITLDVTNPNANRYFSFASMVIPSNDAFIGNLNQLAYNILDRYGQLSRPTVITVYGEDVWDGGTEVNNPAGAAAFSTGGGTAVNENGVITTSTGLGDFIGTGLPTGTTLARAFSARTPIARITIGAPGQSATPDKVRPTITLVNAPVISAAATSATAVLEINDASGVNLANLDTEGLRIIGPSSTRLRVSAVTTDAGSQTSPTSVRVTFTITPVSNATFTSADNGSYQLVASRGIVSDAVGNEALAKRLGTFSINLT
jgi:hypothetical protein